MTMPTNYLLPFNSSASIEFTSNIVPNETHAFSSANGIDGFYNVLVPKFGPFLDGSVTLTHTNGELLEESDYLLTGFHEQASLHLGVDVYTGITILAPELTGNFDVTYTSIGGNLTDALNADINNDLIKDALTLLKNPTLSPEALEIWNNEIRIMQPSEHAHNVSGQDAVVHIMDELRNIKLAIEAGPDNLSLDDIDGLEEHAAGIIDALNSISNALTGQMQFTNSLDFVEEKVDALALAVSVFRAGNSSKFSDISDVVGGLGEAPLPLRLEADTASHGLSLTVATGPVIYAEANTGKTWLHMAVLEDGLAAMTPLVNALADTSSAHPFDLIVDNVTLELTTVPNNIYPAIGGNVSRITIAVDGDISEVINNSTSIALIGAGNGEVIELPFSDGDVAIYSEELEKHVGESFKDGPARLIEAEAKLDNIRVMKAVDVTKTVPSGEVERIVQNQVYAPYTKGSDTYTSNNGEWFFKNSLLTFFITEDDLAEHEYFQAYLGLDVYTLKLKIDGVYHELVGTNPPEATIGTENGTGWVIFSIDSAHWDLLQTAIDSVSEVEIELGVDVNGRVPLMGDVLMHDPETNSFFYSQPQRIKSVFDIKGVERPYTQQVLTEEPFYVTEVVSDNGVGLSNVFYWVDAEKTTLRFYHKTTLDHVDAEFLTKYQPNADINIAWGETNDRVDLPSFGATVLTRTFVEDLRVGKAPYMELVLEDFDSGNTAEDRTFPSGSYVHINGVPSVRRELKNEDTLMFNEETSSFRTVNPEDEPVVEEPKDVVAKKDYVYRKGLATSLPVPDGRTFVEMPYELNEYVSITAGDNEFYGARADGGVDKWGWVDSTVLSDAIVAGSGKIWATKDTWFTFATTQINGSNWIGENVTIANFGTELAGAGVGFFNITNVAWDGGTLYILDYNGDMFTIGANRPTSIPAGKWKDVKCDGELVLLVDTDGNLTAHSNNSTLETTWQGGYIPTGLRNVDVINVFGGNVLVGFFAFAPEIREHSNYDENLVVFGPGLPVEYSDPFIGGRNAIGEIAVANSFLVVHGGTDEANNHYLYKRSLVDFTWPDDNYWITSWFEKSDTTTVICNDSGIIVQNIKSVDIDHYNVYNTTVNPSTGAIEPLVKPNRRKTISGGQADAIGLAYPNPATNSAIMYIPMDFMVTGIDSDGVVELRHPGSFVVYDTIDFSQVSINGFLTNEQMCVVELTLSAPITEAIVVMLSPTEDSYITLTA